MKTSETISVISTALLSAQKQISFAAKEANNPFFKSKYADLPTVIDAIKPHLNDAGIVFVQSASPSEKGELSLTTRLIHTSGEWLEDTMTMPIIKNDPQSYGSAVTYARRYSLAAITGLYQEDDDGNAATKKPESVEPVHNPEIGQAALQCLLDAIKKEDDLLCKETYHPLSEADKRAVWTMLNNHQKTKVRALLSANGGVS